MTVHLEGEIVGSRLDHKAQAYVYTIERGGRRWTVSIPHKDIAQRNKLQRRQHLANALENAMRGPADGE